MQAEPEPVADHRERPSVRRSGWSARRVARWTVRVVVVLAAVASLYVGITFVQVWWASTRDDVRPADVIVVLGAAQYDGRPSPVFRARLDRAHELYREGVAPLIATTGANRLGDRFTEAYAGFGYLRRLGVPESALIVVDDGANTWEALSATARVLRARGDRSVVLVSDGYHALRLGQTAGELGLDATVARTAGTASFRRLTRETAAVSVGRIIGYRRLANLS